MSSLLLKETPLGQLQITTPRGKFTVEPLPASKGAPLAAQLMGVTFAGEGLTEDEQQYMYRLALGAENFTWIMENLRLCDAQDCSNAALYWQVSGIESAQAFVDGGVEKAMEVHLARMGLSLSTILRHLAAENEIQSPDDTSATSTQKTSESKSSAAPEPKKKPATRNTGGKKSSQTGRSSS